MFLTEYSHIRFEMSLSVSLTVLVLFSGVDGSNMPHFDIYKVENHTVQLGATAFLPCVIKNLGNKSVRLK